MKARIINSLNEIDPRREQEEILQRLSGQPRSISPKYFYNKDGSELFESITELEEYYPTRTEKSILSGIVENLKIGFQALNIVELGSGDPSKIMLLLRQLPDDLLQGIHYYPMDISHSALTSSVSKLAESFPQVRVTAILTDFFRQLDKLPRVENRLICFLGSTVGNFDPDELRSFMTRLGAEMDDGDHLLLGLDMVKDPKILHRAYNDSRQITAAFNKNILNVVNEIAETSFDPAGFEHHAFYNDKEKRVEMHLRALRDQVIRVNGSQATLEFREGDTIHTENSYKFRKEDIARIGQYAELTPLSVFTDARDWFSLVLFGRAPSGG